MFRLNLNLSQKAFLLVALPLICELIVLGSLAVLLTQAEEETRKERHARQVIAESNLLLKDFLDCSIYSYQLNKMRDPATMKQFDALYEQIPMRIRSLKIELRDSPDQKAALERIEQVASKGIEMLAEFRRIALEGGSIVELAEKRRILSQQGQLLLDTIRHFVNAQESALLSKPDTEFKFRMLIVQCIGSGVLASIILAVALTMYFNRGTMRRLSVLMDNTSRLAKGQPLNPVVTGGDEIAHLDKIFHEMADALADAARRKQELMSMVSHDLRTPLTSMQGSLTLLNEGILGKLPERAEHEVARAE
ncbi:MAG TPA: histidine kinase dimerization/phospho-acceptor domain-containing protein [Candidatus Obscuribacterales bacterium]